MKKQQDHGLNLCTRRSRKVVLLDEISLVMSWAELVTLDRCACTSGQDWTPDA